MPIVSRSIDTVKTIVARVTLDLQLAYSSKVAEVIAEPDPEDLVQLCDSATRGEYIEVVINFVIIVQRLV
jgi:hypothetical protein